jgi:predicted DsbA family dithiol-disulfide isomerase
VRLRQLRQDLPVPVELAHRAFLLLPDERERTFTEYHLRHRRSARELTGLPFDLPPVGAPYPRSSLPALEAAEWIKERHPEQFEAYDLALYDAFFRETRDISDPQVLGDLATDLGLDRGPLERALASRDLRDAVWADYDMAQRLGITSIPTAKIGSRWISGAVPYEEYLEAARTSLEAGGSRPSAGSAA